jgi:putative membrane protein
MKEFLLDYYLWLKAFHLIAVIAWMAGMLYLPRLFVYHCQTAPGSEGGERFKVMERKLLKGILNPSMGAVWLLGLTLAWITEAYTQPWFHLKFLLVFILSGFHGFLSARAKDFAADRNSRSERFYRIINEVPAVIMIAVVLLAVVKPFG